MVQWLHHAASCTEGIHHCIGSKFYPLRPSLSRSPVFLLIIGCTAVQKPSPRRPPSDADNPNTQFFLTCSSTAPFPGVRFRSWGAQVGPNAHFAAGTLQAIAPLLVHAVALVRGKTPPEHAHGPGSGHGHACGHGHGDGVVGRARKSEFAMISMDAAYALIEQHTPVLGAEERALGDWQGMCNT